MRNLCKCPFIRELWGKCPFMRELWLMSVHEGLWVSVHSKEGTIGKLWVVPVSRELWVVPFHEELMGKCPFMRELWVVSIHEGNYG